MGVALKHALWEQETRSTGLLQGRFPPHLPMRITCSTPPWSAPTAGERAVGLAAGRRAALGGARRRRRGDIGGGFGLLGLLLVLLLHFLLHPVPHQSLPFPPLPPLSHSNLPPTPSPPLSPILTSASLFPPPLVTFGRKKVSSGRHWHRATRRPPPRAPLA